LLGLPMVPPDLLEDLLQAVLPVEVLEEVPGVEARHELDGGGVQRAYHLDTASGIAVDQLQHIPGRVQKVKRHIPQVFERGHRVGPPRHVEVVDDHVAGDQFGDGLLLPPGQRADSVQDSLVADVRLDLVLGAPSLDQLDDVQAAAFDQVVHLVDGEGPVLRMQQQVHDAGVAEFLMVSDDVLAALETIRLRQAVQHDFGVRELGLQIGCIEVDAAQQLLQLIHASSPVLSVEHNGHGTVVLEHGPERLQASPGIVHVMQHPDAVDVVEGPELQGRQVQNGAVHPSDVGEVTDLRPASSDLIAPLADGEMHDLGTPVIAQLLGQEDGLIAGPAACYKYLKFLRKIAPPLEAVDSDELQ